MRRARESRGVGKIKTCSGQRSGKEGEETLGASACPYADVKSATICIGTIDDLNSGRVAEEAARYGSVLVSARARRERKHARCLPAFCVWALTPTCWIAANFFNLLCPPSSLEMIPAVLTL